VKILIEMPEETALTFLEELNRDEGIRERATNKLMQQSGTDWVSGKTAVVAALGAIAAGVHVAVAAAGLLNKERRQRELYLLAFPNKD
jgi:hypothetical protein